MSKLQQFACIAKSFDCSSDADRRAILENTFGGSTDELKHCACTLLSSPRYARDQDIRLGALSMLLYLGRGGLDDLSKLLSRRSKPIDFEIHFSLFCRLGRELFLKDPQVEKKVLGLLRDYLLKIRSPRAEAAWMCGDLLHHWETGAATRILFLASRKANYPPGRIGAVHGLQHVLNNASRSRRNAILRILRHMLHDDPSPKVRRYVERTLRFGGCWTENRS